MKLTNIIGCMVVALGMVACSEDDGTIEEFPEWQSRNDSYFSELVSTTKEKVAAGDTSWELLSGYNKPTKNYTLQYSDYVVVEKFEPYFDNSKETDMPLLTDTVEVHYRGQLLTSANAYKTSGLVFDSSYSGDFDPVVATPVKLAVKSVVSGFGTALLHMHRGDHWKIYIPYQLGYSAATKGSIPAYSTLIFDLRLEDFWSREDE
jgi:FKBP-type peptidyl-prolyl cis-trans isomerase FklB